MVKVRDGISHLRSVLVVLIVLVVVALAAPALADDTVGIGATSAGRHYRFSRSDDRIQWSHIHFAVLETCSYGADYLARRSQTKSWTTYGAAPIRHTVSTQSGLKIHGTLNAGGHHFFTWAAKDVWSPGGQNGWDKCRP